MHFISLPCRSHSGYPPILRVGFSFPNDNALLLKRQIVIVNLSTRALFSLNDSWVNEKFILCNSTFVNALAIVGFTSDSLTVIHFINSPRHILSSFILNCCIIYSDKLSCHRSFATYLVFSYPLAMYLWFLNNGSFSLVLSVSSNRSARTSYDMNRHFFILSQVENWSPVWDYIIVASRVTQ